MLKHAAIILTLLCTSMQPAAAQSDAKAMNAIKPVQGNDPEFKDPTNAALLYYRAFMLMPNELSTKIGDAFTALEQNPIPDIAAIQVIKDGEDVTNTCLRAAKIDTADFGIEYSQGIGALLPHLGKLRQCGRLLALDAHQKIAESKPDEAADRIVALFAMSRHTTGERLLISSLVSNAIHNLACTQVDYLINSGQLTFTGKKKILEAMDRFNIPDAFGIKAAVRGERYWVVVWIRNQVAGPEGVKAFTQQILPLLDDKPDSADVKAINAMDVNAINADLDKAEGYYSSILEVFDLPDAPDRLAALEKKVQDGDFGLIARHAAPAMTKAHQQYGKANTRQSDSRARLANAFAR